METPDIIEIVPQVTDMANIDNLIDLFCSIYRKNYSTLCLPCY